MPDESAAPDLEEQSRKLIEAGNRRDYDAMLALFAPDAIWERAEGLGTYEGHEAIRGIIDDWLGTFADLKAELAEFRDLGRGITLGVFIERGRAPGGSVLVERRYAVVAAWSDGLIERVKNYADVDEARAAAERFAEERA